MLKEQISNDLKEAMREKNELSVSVFRMLSAAIKNKEIALRKGENISLSDEQAAEVISSEIKKRRDSIAEYEKGGRQDLADKEKKEVEILEKYLPEQLSDEEIEKIAREVASSDGSGNFGKIMGQVMAKVKGKADGVKAREIVERVLAR